MKMRDRIVALAFVSVIALGCFVWHELRTEHPVVDLRVFRHRALVVGCTYGAAMGIGLYGSIFLFPLFTQNVLRWTAWQSGLAVLPSTQLAGQVVIFGVDPLETKEKAGGILDELKATYPAVLDSSGEVTDHYRVGKGLPKTYFIDREGILRGVKTGELRPEELAKFLAQMGVTYTPK